MAVLGVVNVFLGGLAALSAAFNVTFYLLRTVDNLQQCLVDASLAFVTAVLGITSGLALLKHKSVSRWLCLTFAVVLVSIVTTSVLDGTFDPTMDTLMGLYAVVLIVLTGTPVWKTVGITSGRESDA